MTVTNYKILANQKFKFEDFEITPIRFEHRYQIMDWRNEQINLLRQKNKLTKQEQDNYFKKIIFKQFQLQKPTQILFSFFYQNKLIGYGGLVHINWIHKNAEISFLLKTELNKKNTYHESFKIFLFLIEKVAISINLHKIFTYGYDLFQYRFYPLIELNFHKEATLKKHKKINGKLIDILIYSKIL